jgi:hypothetical protein
MTERSYQDAVQVLKDRLGSRWEGVENEGRDEMVEILKDKLGYDNRAANDAIDAMIESGTLRYRRANPGEGGAVPPPLAPVGEGVASGVPAAGGLGGLPLAAGVIANAGHWEIGPGESDAPGRAGQVEPR